MRVILFVGILFRLLAVIFARGFGWIDDQFLIVEIAQSWVDGSDYYKWLPWTPGNEGPKGFSFFYVGINYVVFIVLEFLGLTHPEGKMFVVRLIHAAWSLLIITYGYKLAKNFRSERSARLIAWLLAIFWMFPFLSVRTLVEFVSVPFLMIAYHLATKEEKKVNLMTWIWIGFLFGIAINIRYQTALIGGGVGLVLLFQRKWVQATMTLAGALLALVLFQGLVDYLIWGKPFAQVIAYISYNVSSAGEYTVGPWYHYILFLLGAMIPPVSIFIFLGYARGYKKLLIIFVPILLFIAFHSWYPNKQERFMITIIPLLFVAGIIGWKMFADGALNPPGMRKLIRGSWIFFLIMNFVLLLPVSVMYSKKSKSGKHEIPEQV